MPKATRTDSTSRIVARHDNVVAVDFRNRPAEPEPPKFPGSVGARQAEPQELQDAANNAAVLHPDDDVVRVACYPRGRRVA
jgi:hypothetical protein